ncbi:hypothetical protein [Lentibacillus juripiscarius]|uniref:Uncharacterized protein n=1 Tax=Lentibacillus juripiscarius TaxID=257446 RepID=A0ABW5V537_9BACI
MKKRFIASAAGVLGAGVTSYMLINRQNRKNRSDNRESQFDSTLKDAGMPDQVDVRDVAQMKNAKMVSEGSQFGVDYYNTVKEENIQE